MKVLEDYNISFYRWDYQKEDDFLEESLEIADTDVEGTGWSPIKGREPENLRIIFVDGIRGLHQAVYLEDEQNRGEGFFVTLCAGALSFYKEGKSTCSEYLFSMKKRLFITNVPVKNDILVEWSNWEATFKPVFTKEDPLDIVTKYLGNLEYKVVESSIRLSSDFVLWDGTLKYNLKTKDLPVAGFVKRHLKYFIPGNESGILRYMEEGYRTPIIYLLDKEEDFNRYTWYVKIGEGGITGTLRIEVPESIGIEKAKYIADCSAWLFPKIVSAPFTDRRSPHNVVPIKFLEKVLYKEIGNANIIRRAIEVSLSKFKG